MRLAILMSALMVGGCISDISLVHTRSHPGGYRDVMVEAADDAVRTGPYASAPDGVRKEYSECSADYVISKFTEAERSRLDAYARGESIPLGELKQMDKSVMSRGRPLSYANIDDLGGICPQSLSDFHQYFGPGFNGL